MIELPTDLTQPVDLPGRSGYIFRIKLSKDGKSIAMVYGTPEDMASRSYGSTQLFPIGLYTAREVESAKQASRRWLTSYSLATEKVVKHVAALVERALA